jgi:hypothetical protein
MIGSGLVVFDGDRVSGRIDGRDRAENVFERLFLGGGGGLLRGSAKRYQ